MIAGTGIDLVDIGRMERILNKWGERFTEKIFSLAERNYCDNRACPAIHYAARFAAKESFLKSLGLGLGMGVHLTDIEVVNNDVGRPLLKLKEGARMALEEGGIKGVHLSLSHTRTSAAAVVILEK